MAKTSIKAAVRDAKLEERKLLKLLPDGSATKAATADSFTNFAQKLGVGADNALTTATYGFNPITRNRTLLEWIHRGSWLGGVAIDVVADDMTRAGIEFLSELAPEDHDKLGAAASQCGLWQKTNETLKWGRLYGGAVAVMLIDGQDVTTPLNLDTVGKGQFKGLLVLDRWQLDPALEDLVTDLGPDLGKPKFYRVFSNAPALRGKSVHYSRLAYRVTGIELPYQQALTENLWGISVIERLYDRMIAYDSASTGAAQLVYKSYLRTLKIKGLREVVSAGGPAMDGLLKYTEIMRRFQGIEGITLIDGEDEYDAQAHGAFSGLDSALMQFAQQLSGALQIPLTRLFGQSPSGLNASGDNDMRNYYDHIKQRQETDLHGGVHRCYRALAASEGIKLPDNFALGFRSLWQLTDADKATIAKTITDTVNSTLDGGSISAQTALKELRQSSRTTGVWTNITEELITAAEEDLPEPGNFDPETGAPTVQLPTAPRLPGQEKQNEKQAGSQRNTEPVGGVQGRGTPVRKSARAGS